MTNSSNNPIMHIIQILLHHSEVILGGILVWILSALGAFLPKFTMLVYILAFFDINHALPWMQGGVYSLAMMVSVLTLFKLMADLKWFKKKK